MKQKTRGKREGEITVALVGNPNVGKSTLFNTMTGLSRHTGNWTGKTLDCACATCRAQPRLHLIDLPGMYAWHEGEDILDEEAAALRCLQSGEVDAVVVVCDAGALSRNLFLAMQLQEKLQIPMALLINLCAQARAHGIEVDAAALEEQLHMPVWCVEAYDRHGLRALAEQLLMLPRRAVEQRTDGEAATPQRAAALAQRVTRCEAKEGSAATAARREIRLERFLTGRISGYLTMLGLLALLMWLTMVGANILSDYLSDALGYLERALSQLALSCLPPVWCDFLIGGVVRTVFWVVSVMLPPMAIFFPLFSALEDFGYLPRMAFLLDRPLARCHACGKQALTMCMGLGCNSVGVMGCRIIDSPRERKIAMLTNSLIPCNGRLPTLCILITMFFTVGVLDAALAAACLLTCLLLAVGATITASYLLSRTVLRGESSSYVLELPPYRRPRWGQLLVRSVLDRTLKILGRAVLVSAPAGAILWLVSHLQIGGVPIVRYLTDTLQTPGRLLGVDGVVLTALLLSFPANELFLPLVMMLYRGSGVMEPLGAYTELYALLSRMGWGPVTAICTLLLVMFHAPCATTLVTLYKESRSSLFTVAAALLPLAVGVVLCFILASLLG